MKRFLVLILWLLAVSVALAQEGGEATEEPSSAPVEYTLPAPPAWVNTDWVIGRVGDETISLGDFAGRVRYERLRRYRLFNTLISIAGVEALNPEDPNNVYAADIVDLLSSVTDDDSFGALIYDTMLIEHLYTQEAEARGLIADECIINEYWFVLLGYQEAFDCTALPEMFEQDQAAYLQEVETFAGLSAEDIAYTLASVAQYSAVQEALIAEAPIEEVDGVATRHIRVSDEVLAQEIVDRLNAGEDFDALLAEYTEDAGAVGNLGELGLIARGQTIPEFEEPAFNAEVGQIVGPVQTQFGWHVIKVNERFPSANARHILVGSESDAQSVLDLLDGGADFAEVAVRFSLDTATASLGGDLGAFTPDDMPEAFSEAVFNAQAGDFVGPIQTEDGWHIIEVLRIDPAGQIDVSHILLATEEEAQAVIDRLNAGEDFGEVAAETSIDPSAPGHRGDTLTILSQGALSGMYVPDEVPIEIAQSVFPDEVQVGDVVGPIPFGGSYFVLLVTEKGMRQPTQDSVMLTQDFYVQDWETAQYESNRIQPTTLWRLYMPFDLLPSEYNPTFAPLDATVITLREGFETGPIANDLVNILSELRVSESEN